MKSSEPKTIYLSMNELTNILQKHFKEPIELMGVKMETGTINWVGIFHIISLEILITKKNKNN